MRICALRVFREPYEIGTVKTAFASAFTSPAVTRDDLRTRWRANSKTLLSSPPPICDNKANFSPTECEHAAEGQSRFQTPLAGVKSQLPD